MKSRIVIEVETSNLKPYIEDGDDLSAEQETEFHRRFYKVVDEFLTDEDFQGKFMSDWIHDAEYLNPSAEEFSDIGKVSIRISDD